MRFPLLLAVLLLCLPAVEAQAIERDAREAISRAEGEVQEMSEAGFGLSLVTSALIEAKRAYAEKDYLEAIEGAREISERRDRAFEISDSLRAVEFRIRDAGYSGLDASRAAELLEDARGAFQSENYQDAGEFLLLANKELDGVEAEYSLVNARVNAARENLLLTIRERWASVSLGFLTLAVLAAVAFVVADAALTRHRLEDLELKLRALEDLKRKAQKMYFKEAAMSRDMYRIRMAKYREMALEIKQKMPLLRDRLRRFERLGFKPRTPSGQDRPLTPRQ